jgi:hypothetical protein
MSSQRKPDDKLYYIENGLIVFTEAYHLERGYCCKSGCRHCPYDRKTAKNGGLKPGLKDTDDPNKSNT